MTAEQLPDLEQIKAAIRQAREAEDHLLEVDRNGVLHDGGHPILAPNDDDRRSLTHARTHGRRRRTH